MAADHLGGCALACGAQFPQPGRRGRAEDAHLAEQPVAGSGVTPGCPVHAGLDVQQFEEITDGDGGEHAALGGQDDRGPAQRAGRFRRGCALVSFTERPQLREPPRVAGGGHRAGQPAVVTSAGGQPAQRGTQDIGADRADQRWRQQDQTAGSRPAGPRQPAAGQLCPGGPRSLSAAGQPAFLPAAAVLAGEPVQQQRQPRGVPPGLPAAWPGHAAGQLPQDLPAGQPGGWPARERWPGREPGPPGLVARQPYRRRRRRCAERGSGHDGVVPNSTSRLSRRYPGAAAGRARPRAWRTCSLWWARTRRITSSLRGVRYSCVVVSRA